MSISKPLWNKENLNKSFIRLRLFRQLLIDKTTAPNKLHQYNKAKQSNRPCLDYDCPESWAITIVLIFSLKSKVQIFMMATPFLFRSVSWEPCRFTLIMSFKTNFAFSLLNYYIFRFYCYMEKNFPVSVFRTWGSSDGGDR